ncbi:MAG: D-alanyl-D-alanine endopeptidase [Deltaproteobacteria bacterium]|nr:D-alanyl-D-alanine endopeptidase [Deltaproteobacteria bacterium]
MSHEPSPIDIHQIHFSSRSVMVYDDASNRVLYARNADDVVPIASITKLMTATVILDAHLPMHTPITVTEEDVDMLRHSSSRLPVGAVLPRRELLRLSLMSSENRATHALARTYPGGVQACVAAMNHKARALGMSNTFFADPTGLYSTNRSTAHDLMVLVKNSYQYELIQEFTTTPECKVASNKGCIAFRNTNPLVREGRWDIELSKTGFINEAGLCMVMKANIADRPVIIVLLDANSKEGRLQDANNIKRWIEAGTRHALTAGYGFRPGERS